jgi:site-specific recombinase XerD
MDASKKPGQIILPRDLPKETPLHVCIKTYLTYLAIQKGLEKNTVFHYGHDLLLFRRHVERKERTEAGKILISQLNSGHIISFLDEQISQRGNSISSNRRRLACLRGFIRFLQEKGLKNCHEALSIPFPNLTPQIPVALTDKEVDAFLKACQVNAPNPIRDYAIFLIFLTCGCRLSELLRLRLKDVDLEKSTIRFRHSDNTERLLILAPRTKVAIEAYLKDRPIGHPDRFFLNRHEQPITKGAIYHSFYRCLSSAGIRNPHVSVHTLRHTFIKKLLEQGYHSKDKLLDMVGNKTDSSFKKMRIRHDEAVAEDTDKIE